MDINEYFIQLEDLKNFVIYEINTTKNVVIIRNIVILLKFIHF